MSLDWLAKETRAAIRTGPSRPESVTHSIVIYFVPWCGIDGLQKVERFRELGTNIGSASLSVVNCFQVPEEAAKHKINKYPTVLYHRTIGAEKHTREFTADISDLRTFVQATLAV